MNNLMLKILVTIQGLVQYEEGQDLVEYSLVFTTIALGCVASMGSLASGIDSVFRSVCQTLSSNVK
jgi:Flp pilus assembly pilin Flp